MEIVLAASIPAAIAAIASILVSRQNHRKTRSLNSGEHVVTDDLLIEIRDEMREVRADVRDVKADVRSITTRVQRLEHS